MDDNKFGMKKYHPTPTHFREPLKHELKLSGSVQVHPPGHAESLQDRRRLDDDFELLPGFQSSSSKDQDDPIWSDKTVDTQRASNCSTDFKVSVKT